MPTFAVQVKNNQVLLQVHVTTVQAPQEGDHPWTAPHEGGHTWTALLDTGAQCTFVSPRVIQQLDVPSTGIANFMPANGEPVETDVYRLSISVPISLGTADDPTAPTFSSGSVVDVMLLPFNPEGYDVIFGMDLVSRYHITLHNGLFVCSN